MRTLPIVSLFVWIILSSCLAEYIFQNGQGQLTFDGAKEFCSTLHIDARLAMIQSSEQNEEVRKIISGDAGSEAKWFGLKYDETSDAYTWINGDDANDAALASWHDLSLFGSEPIKCGAMKEDGAWEVRDCISTGKRDFICEIPWGSTTEMIAVWGAATVLYTAGLVALLALLKGVWSYIGYAVGSLSAILAAILMAIKQNIIIFIIGGCIIFVTLVSIGVVTYCKLKKTAKSSRDWRAVFEMQVFKKK